MEEMNTMTVDAVTEEGTAYDTDTTASTTETIEETTEVVDTQTEDYSQKGEKSNRFADYRRKEELRVANERLGTIEKQNKEYTDKIAAYEAKERRLSEILGSFYEGNDLDSIILSLEAQAKGVSVDALKAEMAENEARQKAKQAQDDELAFFKGFWEKKQREEAQKMYDEDLAAVKALDPAINSLEELGEDFERLRFTVNPMTGEYYSVADVYNHIKSKIKPLPQTSGAVNTVSEDNKEVDFTAMSNEEFEKYYNKVVYGG